ncbi:hypothetical protein KQX54_007290 [Cotesia glomerata]|uniref:Uncharacterized protein n=1 Tax=Cotesia glomerata TaxID=32391 RepID=A0AAV7HHU2_COTGL|nr:hypothetical protein KQX54_007290 [Cotesia glomerata]
MERHAKSRVWIFKSQEPEPVSSVTLSLISHLHLQPQVGKSSDSISQQKRTPGEFLSAGAAAARDHLRQFIFMPYYSVR